MNHDPSTFPIGEAIELEPGVLVERRDVLRTLAAAVAFGGISSGVAAATPLGRRLASDAALGYDEFLAEAVPVAKQLVDDQSPLGERRYLHALAAVAVRMGEVGVPNMRPSGQGPEASIGVNPGGDPFIVLHWRIGPGGRIRTHAHTYGNVVTLGLEGAARVSNYELNGPADFETEQAFEVVQTADQLLVPGTINLVPLHAGYCHGFVAGPDGARGLDLTTRTRPRRDTTPYLVLGEQPADAEQRLWEGRWEHE